METGSPRGPGILPELSCRVDGGTRSPRLTALTHALGDLPGRPQVGDSDRDWEGRGFRLLIGIKRAHQGRVATTGSRVVVQRMLLDSPDVLLQVSGVGDLNSRSQLGESVREALAEQHRSLVIDLSGIRFVDTAGLRMLLVLRQLAESRGVPHRFVCPPGSVVRQVAQEVGFISFLSCVRGFQTFREELESAAT